MKRWMLDVLVGITSIIALLLLFLVMPIIFSPNYAYLIGLLLFLLIISIGGFLIRKVPT
ncbi:MAG: hypothetical protein JXA44_00610 [Methanospirillaceae archaeon]|nr:hypothetical protein [Methanospirillaceae archaeon]